jgi:hypothetical protein
MGFVDPLKIPSGGNALVARRPISDKSCKPSFHVLSMLFINAFFLFGPWVATSWSRAKRTGSAFSF